MKNKAIGIIAVLLAITAGITAYNAFCGDTEIAFINFRTLDMSGIARANDNSHIKVVNLPLEDLKKAKRFDMVFINGMGLRITEEQRETLKKAAGKGTPFYTSMATNPDNDICNLDDSARAMVQDWLSSGGKRNYRSMLNYVRSVIDGKKAWNKEFEEPVKQAYDIIYRTGRDGSEHEFGTVGDYEKWLAENGLYKDGAKNIVVTGQMADATGLINALDERGYNVYPILSFRMLIPFMQEIGPDAFINLAHGRLGDKMTEYLKENNIPYFAPLTIMGEKEEWESEPMGMSGGFMSQSIVTPEIDGAILPYALFAEKDGKDGIRYSYAMPDRLECFLNIVDNYMELADKANKDKKIAIVYYKGPGQNALTAGGMDVTESLYNFLKRLKKEGYDVSGLPSDIVKFRDRLMKEGAVFNTYAEGAIDDFIRTAGPELISKEEYESMLGKTLSEKMKESLYEANGEFPGSYMAADDNRLAIARVRFGNIVLMPQQAVGGGNNAFQMVHGTDNAPSHNYVAAYLWLQHGFEADAMIHFGTHGSLEFTPRKQTALSSNDWPDRLVGEMPHFYVYSIGNVGEGMIAKRRSYAVLQSYLTPPFLESGLRGEYKDLMEKIESYRKAVYEEYDAGQDETGYGNTETAAKGTGTAPAAGKPESRNRHGISKSTELAREITALAIKSGLHRDLGLDSTATEFNDEEISKIENFAEEIASEKITGQLYSMGSPYEHERIISSVKAMSEDPIAYNMYFIDKAKGMAPASLADNKALFRQKYLIPAEKLVDRILKDKAGIIDTDKLICEYASVSMEDMEKAEKIKRESIAPKGMEAMIQAMMQQQSGKAASEGKAGEKPAGEADGTNASGMQKMMKAISSIDKQDLKEIMSIASGMDMNSAAAIMKTAHSGKDIKTSADSIIAALPEKDREAAGKIIALLSGTDKKHAGDAASKGGKPAGKAQGMAHKSSRQPLTKQEKELYMAIADLRSSVSNIRNYKKALEESPEAEFKTLLNSLDGGYTAPSPGGDIIANPNTLPTGRNMFAINAEATPSETAWEKGVALAKNTISMYRKRHGGEYPRKVSYTLWSGEFIETEGATIAQILYMLGVEPLRDTYGRVTDLRLIPSEDLGRPRIDVVVQTSGQLRDIAASRLFLISKAVEMAAAASDDSFENNVKEGIRESERILVEKGISPKQAREMSHYRVFGGLNGGYGTGIQGMVTAGDRWENESEIASAYMNNMGAFYGSDKDWEKFGEHAFEAALSRTDAVVQPRQSNTWGALSLDHVYEFMGGLNLAVRNVTGKDPDAYLSDYRNHNNMRMQELKEAIGVESRSTIFNPAYIKEKMKGGASDAGTFAEIVTNTYGWNVMKPEAIDDELWDRIYDVYVKDSYDLGIKEYFENSNPAALEEMTAVMLETARKGMWNASQEQIGELAKLHTGLISEYKPSCSGFVCDNAKLRGFIASKTDASTAEKYTGAITDIREKAAAGGKGMVMKKETIDNNADRKTAIIGGTAIAACSIALLALIILFVRKKRRERAA